MLNNLKHEVTQVLFRVEPITPEQMQAMEQKQRDEAEASRRSQVAQHEQLSALGEPGASEPEKPSTFVREQSKVGRNEPCPCGSGKKYKACHGKLA